MLLTRFSEAMERQHGGMQRAREAVEVGRGSSTRKCGIWSSSGDLKMVSLSSSVRRAANRFRLVAAIESGIW